MTRLNLQYESRQYCHYISGAKHLNISFVTAAAEKQHNVSERVFFPYLKHREPWQDSICLMWLSGVIKAGNETGGWRDSWGEGEQKLKSLGDTWDEKSTTPNCSISISAKITLGQSHYIIPSIKDSVVCVCAYWGGREREKEKWACYRPCRHACMIINVGINWLTNAVMCTSLTMCREEQIIWDLFSLHLFFLSFFHFPQNFPSPHPCRAHQIWPSPLWEFGAVCRQMGGGGAQRLVYSSLWRTASPNNHPPPNPPSDIPATSSRMH